MKIFISYSFKDEKEVHTLTNSLRKHKHDVFNTNNTVFSDKNWVDTIYKTIQDAELLIALITDNFLSSPSCSMEVGAFVTVKSTHARLLPIIVGNVIPPSYLLNQNYLKVDTLQENESIEKITNFVNDLAHGDFAHQPNVTNKVILENNLIEENIKSLNKALLDNRLSLVCGAGVSLSSKIPNWNTLLVKAFTNAFTGNSDDLEKVNVEDLLKKLPKSNLIIAKILKDLLKEEFAEKIREILYTESIVLKGSKPSELMKAIAYLAESKKPYRRLASIITLNFDDIIEQSLAEMGISYCSIWKEGQSYNTELLPIYHVHGFLPMSKTLDEPNLVFAEDSYHTQYVDPFVWSNLIQLITYSSNVCLFVGLSLNDPNMRRLLDYSCRKNNTQKHFIILKSLPEENRTDRIASMLMEKNANSFGLNVIWVTDHDQTPQILLRIAQ